MANNDAEGFSKELLDQLLAGRDPKTVLDSGGLIGDLYLACVMNLASRRIVGWSMSDRIRAELVCEALKSAYWRRKPGPGLIMHSDSKNARASCFWAA